MKKMFCFVMVMMGTAAAAFCQDNVIELVVRDTMMLQPKAWLYTVELAPDYETTTITADTAYATLPSTPPPVAVPPIPNSAAEKEKGTTIEQVTALAKKFGAQATPEENEFLTVNRKTSYSYSNRSATYLFTNLQSLKSFVQALAALKDVDGRIATIVPVESQPVMTALDTRLVTTARKRAENLAAVSGRKLGEVVLITEDYGNGTSFLQTLVEDVFKNDLFGKSGRRWSLSYDAVVITRSLKVRFALR